VSPTWPLHLCTLNLKGLIANQRFLSRIYVHEQVFLDKEKLAMFSFVVYTSKSYLSRKTCQGKFAGVDAALIIAMLSSISIITQNSDYKQQRKNFRDCLCEGFMFIFNKKEKLSKLLCVAKLSLL